MLWLINAPTELERNKQKCCAEYMYSKAKEYLDVCVDYYNSCELVEWTEKTNLYEEYKKIELTKGKVR